VQRWEQSYGFPIRRVNPSKGSVVYALQNEVDEWLRSNVIKERHPPLSIPDVKA
jgi:hypothetical protein